MIKVTRTRKARSNGWCALCQQWITVGQPIALLASSWTHARCACRWLADRRDRREEDPMTESDRQDRGVPVIANEWVRLPDGTLRWGRYGAAGLLLHAGGHVLLTRRSRWTHHGGTWAFPGGARHAGETAEDAAAREFTEEVRGHLGGLHHTGVHRQRHPGFWTYTTVLAALPAMREFTADGTETTATAWVPYDDVSDLDLLPDFARSWPAIHYTLRTH